MNKFLKLILNINKMEIDKDLPHIEELIQNNLVVKIVGPASVGKTTNLPKYLAKKYKVVVIVSETSVATSLNRLGFPNVTYISGKEYLKDDLSVDSEILIIDEMDSGSFNNFLIISLWKKSDQNGKLVLNSNTSHFLFPDFPTYTVKKYSYYPPEIRYLTDTVSFTGSVDILIDLVYKMHHSSIEGDFLIFGLRKKSVDTITQKLGFLDAELYSSYDIQKEMYQPSLKRKIIVASSSAKTSLSLKNITCIFDLMRERRVIPTLTGGYMDNVDYISQRDADLRARKSNKSCLVYRFISEETFLLLPSQSEELMFRIPLHHIMLDMYSQNLDPLEFLFIFATEKLDLMSKLFRKYGLIDKFKQVTSKGKLVRNLNLGLRPALLAVETRTRSSLILASLIDKYLGSPFLLQEGFDKTIDYNINYQENVKKFSQFRGDSDVESLFLLWQAFESRDISKTESGKDISNWCSKNHIDVEYMKNVKKSLEDLEKKIVVVEIGKPIFEKLYSDRTMKLNVEKTVSAQYSDLNRVPYKPDSLSLNRLEEKRPLEIYAIITSTVENSDLNSIHLSYISSDVENQVFEKTYIEY